MIPSLILFGALLGRWWRTALVVAAVAWPVLLVLTQVTHSVSVLLGAALLAIVNTALGVLVFQGAVHAWGLLHKSGRTEGSARRA